MVGSDGSTRKPSGSRVRVKRRLEATERDDVHSTRQKMDGSDREHVLDGNPLAIQLYKNEHDDHGSRQKMDESDREPDGDANPLAIELYRNDDDDHGARQKMDEGDREHDRDENPLAIELYKDEDDRQKLSQLTELQREMILVERDMERSEQEWAEFRKRNCSRLRTRETRKRAERAGALAELSRRRSDAVRRQSSGQNPPLTLALRGNPRESISGSQCVVGESPQRNHAARRHSIGQNSGVNERPSTLAVYGNTSRCGSGSNGVNRELPLISGTAPDSDEDDIWLCPVRRVDTRGFDCRYEFDNKTTYKYLTVVWGPESTATNWPMDSVSNASPTRKEFDQWLREVKQYGGSMITKEEARQKKYAIQQRNLILENRAIVPMGRHSIVRAPSSIAAERIRLRSELETVDDVVEVERIKARLEELEGARQAGRDVSARAFRLAEMNRRNRIENLRNSSEKKPVNPNLKAGDPGYDPFSRRWTRSTNYYRPKSSTAGEKNDDATAAAADSSTGIAVSADPRAGTEAASGAGKSADTSAPSAEMKAAAGAGKAVDTSAPVEQGTEWYRSLHNFDLPISLDALQRFGGPRGFEAGFMANKQRIEAHLGRKAPEDDGREHDRSLTITDYMRRRGLL
ncbi:protein RTF1 [Sesamum alatum]|uniref:Protein RTF1 n=1 Tax=Sesamum alatum TaxID=300844 RepID=A0AAE1Y045_9LAMI|nr:protein RTF1 [Sesamum alatum]